MPRRELAEVGVQDQAGPVGPSPGFPRGDDQDAHAVEPTLAVVVATRDRPHLLAGLLDALAGTLDAACELVVVDSASRDRATVALCETREVRVLRLDQPGTSRARNAGVAATSAPVVAFTDDDCRPAPGWAAALRTALADPAVGFVTGRVVGDRPVPTPLSVTPADAGPLDGHGCNLAVRREALSQTGGFNESLGPGTGGRAAEDQDLLQRLQRVGWSGTHADGAVVVHLQWRGRGAALRTLFTYGVGAGRTQPLRRALWDDALRATAQDLRVGYASGVLAGLCRAAGALVGAAGRAGRRP